MEFEDKMESNNASNPIRSLHAAIKKAKTEASRTCKAIITALCVFCIMEFAIIFHLANRQTVSIPYVIEINKDGTAKYIDNASTTLSEWMPSTATTLKVLEDYIISLRGVSSDVAVQQYRIKKVYAYSTGDALKSAQDYLLENNPLERSDSERVEVSVYAATPFISGSDDIFQLDWNEKTLSMNGALKSETNFRGILKTKRYMPKTKSIQEINPLGIYVTNLNISEIKDGYVIYDAKNK